MERRKQRALRVADVGEFGLIQRFVQQACSAPDIIVGPGHDCALIRANGQRFLFTVDALVEGRHFQQQWLSPRQLGRKSFVVNASDVAAMGGVPRWCVVSLGLPGDYRVADAVALQRGIADAARRYGASVVGGNLTNSDRLFVSVALLATAPRRLVTRGGARAGDQVYVTGTVGDAALAVRLLRGRSRPRGTGYLLNRFRRPEPRLREGQFVVAAGIASAAIDVSDGIAQDLGHICEASGVGAVLHAERVPRSPAFCRVLGPAADLALHGGEDYEILFTVPPRQVRKLEQSRTKLGCRITRVGEIVPGRRVRIIKDGGAAAELANRGYDHFHIRREGRYGRRR
jgi:thiamine-monophosphate kinase